VSWKDLFTHLIGAAGTDFLIYDSLKGKFLQSLMIFI